MLGLLLALAAAAAPPDEPLAAKLRAAIWKDLQLNAMLDNGNGVGARWYLAAPDEPETPDLYVRDLACRGGHARRLCSFALVRERGPSGAAGDDAPRGIACTAKFVREGSGWLVSHGPSPGGGHSLTSMRCRPRPGG